MTIDDLNYIFKRQLDLKESKLYCMVTDGDYKTILRQPADQLVDLVPVLSCFTYDGCENNMPRFTKNQPEVNNE